MAEFGKAGQGGGNAAALVLAIASFILVYLLFLPADVRNDLLDINDDEEDVDSSGNIIGSVLLSERPGTLAKAENKEFSHSIASFHVSSQKQDSTIKEIDSVSISSSASASRAVPIFLSEIPQNVKLTFNVDSHRGRLAVIFNGEELYRGELTSLSQPLSVENLEKENLLQFEVERPPSWQFWSKSYYDLRGIKMVGTVSTGENEAFQSFVLGKDETNSENVDNAYLTYYVDCTGEEIGKINIELNDILLSSKVPDCGNFERLFIEPSEMQEGRNSLKFTSEGGSYTVDRIVLRVNLKEPVYPLYFFDVNATHYDAIQKDKLNATVQLVFPKNSDERRRAVLDVNNHRISIDTKEAEIARNIDLYVIQGSNVLKIEPQTTIDIAQLIVALDCKKIEDCKSPRTNS